MSREGTPVRKRIQFSGSEKTELPWVLLGKSAGNFVGKRKDERQLWKIPDSISIILSGPTLSFFKEIFSLKSLS